MDAGQDGRGQHERVEKSEMTNPRDEGRVQDETGEDNTPALSHINQKRCQNYLRKTRRAKPGGGDLSGDHVFNQEAQD